jgi:hypothetical protein
VLHPEDAAEIAIADQALADADRHQASYEEAAACIGEGLL